jgi:hypothetical protein
VLVPIQLYQAQACAVPQPLTIATESGSLAEASHYSNVSIPSQEAGAPRVEEPPVRGAISSPRPATLQEDQGTPIIPETGIETSEHGPLETAAMFEAPIERTKGALPTEATASLSLAEEAARAGPISEGNHVGDFRVVGGGDGQECSNQQSIDLNRRTVVRSLTMGGPHDDRGCPKASPISTADQQNLSRLEARVTCDVGPSTGTEELNRDAAIQLAQFHEWIRERDLVSANGGFLTPPA